MDMPILQTRKLSPNTCNKISLNDSTLLIPFLPYKFYYYPAKN